jgi:hypothetical protein
MFKNSPEAFKRPFYMTQKSWGHLRRRTLSKTQALSNMSINARVRREAWLPTSRVRNSYSPWDGSKNGNYVIKIPGRESLPCLCRDPGVFIPSVFVGQSPLATVDCKDVWCRRKYDCCHYVPLFYQLTYQSINPPSTLQRNIE